MTKYDTWYNNIITNAKNRKHINKCYTEIHHILPKSMGGSDKHDNLVTLTAREHFICHWLLIKIYKNNKESYYKMINAMRIMKANNNSQNRYDTVITSKVYEKIKTEYSKLQSEKVSGSKNPMYGKHHSEKSKDNIRKANTGRVQPEHEKIKQKESMIGRKRGEFSQEWKDNLSKARTGENNHMYGKTHSDETKNKIREKATGRIPSDETREKLSKIAKGSKRERKVCEHCGKDIAVNIYAKNHGNNCKSKN